VLESWAGLRPATPDGLPLLGALPGRPRHLIATGHYRNGILLAPATAQVLADLATGVTPSLDLTAFSPARFRS
jgi:glycine oxidase